MPRPRRLVGRPLPRRVHRARPDARAGLSWPRAAPRPDLSLQRPQRLRRLGLVDRRTEHDRARVARPAMASATCSSRAWAPSAAPARAPSASTWRCRPARASPSGPGHCPPPTGVPTTSSSQTSTAITASICCCRAPAACVPPGLAWSASTWVGDIRVLVAHLLARIGASPTTIAQLTAPDYLAALAAARWPGNVRELRNHLEQCAVFGSAGCRTRPRPRTPRPPSMRRCRTRSRDARRSTRSNGLRDEPARPARRQGTRGACSPGTRHAPGRGARVSACARRAWAWRPSTRRRGLLWRTWRRTSRRRSRLASCRRAW